MTNGSEIWEVTGLKQNVRLSSRQTHVTTRQYIIDADKTNGSHDRNDVLVIMLPLPSPPNA